MLWSLALAWSGVVQAQELSIPHEMYTLDNGLTVILAEDHSVPIVQVNLWYHVGSRDEVAGRTGFAHLFEHLMFQGSLHNNQDYFEPLQEIGGQVNGSTTLDRTNYFEGVPAEYLPLALWAEADRMGFLLEATDADRLANQKDVVRNERRQRYENQPYGTYWITLLENVFPEGHPYHHPTIGYHEDLDAATLDDVSAFFRAWYVPNNASLVICGDFDPATARELVDRYFAPIPAGPQPPKTEAPPIVHEQEIELRRAEAGVPHEKVWIAWPTPAVFEPGDAELDLLSSLLADGKDARLYRELVIEQQIAKEIDAFQASCELDSMYVISATAAEGHTTDEIVAEVDRILAELVADGVTDEEVAVGLTNYEARYVDGLETVAAKANQLNSYFKTTGQPDYLEQDLARYRAVTPEGVRSTAETWLGPGRVVLHIWPEEAE
ncbi:MAG: insulinase family protein [Alphaproteobacteria bacterium]|nr:insulinase family protein [Alphaproteobacteria bacterium]